jgi:hypothetical protein
MSILTGPKSDSLAEVLRSLPFIALGLEGAFKSGVVVRKTVEVESGKLVEVSADTNKRDWRAWPKVEAIEVVRERSS